MNENAKGQVYVSLSGTGAGEVRCAYQLIGTGNRSSNGRSNTLQMGAATCLSVRQFLWLARGGSRELDLPMGSELARDIARRVKFTFPDGYNPKGGDNDIYWAVKGILEQKGERDPNPLFHAGRAISRGMSQAISIDNFLHTHGHDKNIILMGKLGIAAAILDAERKSKIYLRDEGRRDEIEFADLPETWHSVFVKMLLEQSVRRDISNIFDNVSVITFNYDRCIERYLAHSLENYLGLNATEAELLMSRLTIVHPYGQVGKLPSSSMGGGIGFGEHIHSSKLPAVAAQIRTFTERVESDDVLSLMHGRRHEYGPHVVISV